MGKPDQLHFQSSQLPNDAVRVAIGAVSTASPALDSGMYYVTCDADCRIKQGDSSVTVTATTGTPMWAKSGFALWVDSEASQYFAVISASGGTGFVEFVLVTEI